MIIRDRKKFWILAMMVVLLGSTAIQSAWGQSSRVEPTWESINQRGYPQWFGDAKLGIFIHWGLYSVPSYASPEGYGEWFYRGLMTGDEGRSKMMQLYGPAHEMDCPAWWSDTLKRALKQYAGLRDHWHAELWSPDDWAELFKASGARYVLLVTKHHDGYCLWDASTTALPNWTSTQSGPRRNIVEELTTAVRQRGLKMGFYYSLTEWTNPQHTWMVSDDREIDVYVAHHMEPQMKELVERYRPSLIFTDGEWNNSAEELHARQFISWYYNTVGPEAVVNDRWGAGHEHGFKTPEYSGGIMDTATPWAECRGLGRSFGLNRNEKPENFLSSQDLIKHFVKLVAAGGGMTLNVGPNADGTIPLIQQERLRDLGHWLDVNGEAIYGTRPYERPFEYREPLVIERNDSVIDFDWVRNAPIKGMSYDNFTVGWEGDIVAPFSEKYTFEVEVDDNMLVVMDGDTLIDYRKDAPEGTASNAQEAKNYHMATASVKMKAGERHHLTVTYEEKELEARARLLWSSKHTERQPVAAAEGFKASYRCMLPTICYTRKGDAIYAISLFTPAPSVILRNLPADFDIHRHKATLLCFPEKECPMRQLGPGVAEVILPAYDTRSLLNAIYDAPGAWAIKIEKR